MQTRPYLRSVLYNAAALVVWSLVQTGLMYFYVRNVLLQSLAAGPDAPPEEIGPMMGGILLLICFNLLLTGALYLSSGFTYAFLHQRAEGDITTESGMIGGATSAASVALLGGLVSVLLSIVVWSPLQSSLMASMPSADTSFPLFGIAFQAASGAVSTCINAFIALVLGLVGGLIGSMVLQSRE